MKKNRKLRRAAAGLLLLSLAVSGCGQTASSAQAEGMSLQKEGNTVTGEFFAMDTIMTVTATGAEAEEAVRKAQEEILRLDSLLSTGEESSEISRLNREGGGRVSQDTLSLLTASRAYYDLSGGAFDISVYPLMECWGFTGEDPKVPGAEAVAEALEKVDGSAVAVDEENSEVSFLKEGMQIDLGGIAKGYTSGKIMEIFRSMDLTGGMVNLGGNVQVCGSKEDGSAYRVGIRDPRDKSELLGVLAVKDAAVVTSGGYERYFEEEGVRYHHILDPSDGYPADSGILSVTVVSENGTLADAMATAIFVRGAEAAEEMRAQVPGGFSYVILTQDGTILLTEDLEEAFETEEDRVAAVS